MQRISDNKAGKASQLRLLVVVSDDYGELGAAMYFLHGIQHGQEVMVMIPHVMAAASRISLPRVAVSSYGRLSDITSAVAQFKPGAVLCFSGYLLTIGKRFSFLKAAWLVRSLRQQGVRIITSDPFLGQLRSPFSVSFAPVLAGGGTVLSRMLGRVTSSAIAMRAYLFHRLLHSALHIYPAPVPANAVPPGLRYRCYFNGDATSPPAKSEAPYWVFVLSEIDYQMQYMRKGEEFVEALVARLRDAQCMQRRVRLVAPKPLFEKISDLLDSGEGVEYDEAPSYHEYLRGLRGAEYAFFWNIYSFSVIHRVIDKRPVFFFSEGHMVDIVPALKRVGIEVFYRGWTPPLLDLSDSLSSVCLEQQGIESIENYQQIIDGMRNCASPMELLGELCVT